MRSIGSVLFGLLVVVILAGIGVGIYNAGLQQGIAQSVDLPAGAVPYYAYGDGYRGFGGGIFGLIIPILFLFLLFGLARAAFSGRRHGWGHHGYGHGPGKWGPGPWMGGQDRDQWIADWHRRLHEAEGVSPGGSAPGGPAGGPGAGSSPGS